MRKYIYIPIVIILGVFIASCSDTTTNPPPVTETGSIFITSTPSNAQIWLDGTNTNKVTPDSVTDLDPGNYTVTLKLSGYEDYTIPVTVVANLQTTKNATLVSTLSLTTFGPDTLWETAGTGVNQPSGLDLSSGMAYGVSGSNNGLVDIYYSTNGTGGQPYLVQSADLYPNLTRVTKFKVGTSGNLQDTVDSPNSAFPGWTDHMGDREPNYVFLYDEDGHYSKLKITGWGSVNNIAFVVVEWIYNNTGADRRF